MWTKMELPVTYLFASLLWIVWCTLHSILIATPVTDYMKKKLGDQFRFYRLFYNTVSLVTLIPLVYYSISIRQARKAAGLTEEELARRLKTKKTAISRLENHSEDIKLSTLERTAIGLGKHLQVSII
jgi:DNA-binding XRE family transcriptional regulator